MYTQKQLIKFGLYAERAHRLAFDIALSAAELSQYGHGIAVIADETRNVGKKLYSLFDNDNTDEAQIIDAVLQLKYLAVNGCLEMMRIHESQITMKKRLAVILDEVMNSIEDIENIFGIKQDLPLVMPRVSEENTAVSSAIVFSSGARFALFSIGGVSFCETTTNMTEVILCTPEQAKGDFIQIRGQKLPLLNYYKTLEASPENNKFITILRITTEYEKVPQQYALLVDGVPEIFYSSIGRHTQPVGIQTELVRECWACEEDRQMMFLDYGKLK